MDAGDLVVPVVVPRRGDRVVQGRGVPTLGQPAGEPAHLVVVASNVHHEAGVERVALSVHAVAGVLHDEQPIPGGEGDVVQSVVVPVPHDDRRQPTRAGRRACLRQAEDPTVGPGQRAGRAGVAGLGEVELAEPGARTEDPVLRALERGGACCRGAGGGVEKVGARVGCHPCRGEGRPARVQGRDVL